MLFDRAGAAFAAHGVEPDQIGHRPAGAYQSGRIFEQLQIAGIPGDQTQILIDHGNALIDILQRGLQHAAIELNRVGGAVDQAHHVFDRQIALAQSGGEHQPRRRTAHHAGEPALGELQQMRIDQLIRQNLAIVIAGILVEGGMGSLHAKKALEQYFEFGDADRGLAGFGAPTLGAPQAEVDEGGCLGAFDQAGRAVERYARHHDDIDQQNPEHAVGERIAEVVAEQRLRRKPADMKRPGCNPAGVEPAHRGEIG